MNEEDRIEISVNQEDVQNIINAYEKDLKYIEQLKQERNNYKELYEKEKEKVEMYENPDDLTLFYMWLDTKAIDKMKRLTNNWNELKNKLIDLFNRSQDICYLNVLEVMQDLEKEVK